MPTPAEAIRDYRMSRVNDTQDDYLLGVQFALDEMLDALGQTTMGTMMVEHILARQILEKVKKKGNPRLWPTVRSHHRRTPDGPA